MLFFNENNDNRDTINLYTIDDIRKELKNDIRIDNDNSYDINFVKKQQNRKSSGSTRNAQKDREKERDREKEKERKIDRKSVV